jgi:hypothetical protein
MLNSDFKEFIQLLNENQVKYLVIGGYAVAIPVQFIDLDNLKKNKKASGRLQDLTDLENLE